MYPIIFKLGKLTITSLGFFTSLGFLLSSFLIFKLAREKFEEQEIVDKTVLVSFFGLLGARISYLIFNRNDFPGFLTFFLLRRYPGLYLLGGVATGIFALYCLTKTKKETFFPWADFFSQGLLGGLLLGKIGAFLNGQDVGKITSLPWGVKAVGYLEKRHPISLYWLLLMVVIIFIMTKVKKKNPPEGVLFSIFLMFFGFSSFSLAFIKEEMLYLGKVPLEIVVGGIFLFLGIFIIRSRLERTIKKDLGALLGLFSKLNFKRRKNNEN